MPVTSIGTPVNTHATSGSVTGTWGGGQSRTAGNVLVAVVSAGAATSAAATAATSGWINQAEQPNSTTANVRIAVWFKVAAGADAAPTITSALSGIGAMDCMLFELHGVNTITPSDVYGVYASGATAGTLATMTAATSPWLVAAANEFAISVFAQNAAAGNLTWTDTGSGGFATKLNGNGVSSVLQTYVGTVSAPAAGAALSDAGHFSVNTSAFGTGYVLVFANAPVLYPREVYANNTAATVTIGGTTAPAGGTVENWTVNVTGAFPATGSTNQFHACDPVAPSEKFLVTAAPGGTGGAQAWSVTRGAENTTPVVHTAGFSIVQVVTAGVVTQLIGTAWLNVVTSFGADPTGVSDSTAAFQAAADAAIAAGGGTIYIPVGNYKQAGTVTRNCPVPLWVVGDGINATIISFTGTGDAWRIYSSLGEFTYGTSFNNGQSTGGGISGLTIDGQGAGAASTGLHMGDIFQYTVNIIVQNFCLAGSIGVHFDNQYYWAEQMSGRIFATNCTQHVVFDVSGALTSSGSYGRMNMLIDISQFNPAFDGVVFQNGAVCYDGDLRIRGNFVSSATPVTSAVLRITGSTPAGHAFTGSSMISYSRLDIAAECTVGAFQPQTIVFGTLFAASTVIQCCWGVLDFGADGPFSQSNIDGSAYLFLYSGQVKGDASLCPVQGNFAGMTVCGPLVYGLDVNFAGGLSQRGDISTLLLAANTTISLTAAWGITLSAPQRITLIIQQAASGGPYTLTWPVNATPTQASPTVIWGGGTPPVMSAAASAVDKYFLETADGLTWYGHAVQQSSVRDAEQFVALTAAYTLGSGTAAQKLFNATTNGAVAVAAATTYFFECVLSITGLSGSSHTLSFGLAGTATYTSTAYQALIATTAGGAVTSVQVATNAATAIATGTTGTVLQATIKGTVRINAAGTLIPQITNSVGIAAVVGASSYFRLWPVGSNTVTSAGGWT